ncbi:MAG: 3-hydroxyacyl-ACP dehydratase FabZ [Eubacteriales bacterium]|nr:3-hydroxyacyl-ACP dehydratase FabZ [Eubacteriales bacterium]
MEKLELNYQEIQAVLPHRHPFLLIDKIVDGEAGQFAVGHKAISGNDPIFQGHFPGQPIYPGVLQVEALAQVGAVALLSLEENKGKIALFAGLGKVRFKSLVKPGDLLELSCRFTGTKGPIGYAEGEARIDGKLACKAELMFALMTEE